MTINDPTRGTDADHRGRRRQSYGFGIDAVVFTVTRNGTAEGEIGGAVTLAQDENFVT